MACFDTAIPLEKEMFLKNIVDTVSSQFPELSFSNGYHALDSNNPVVTITQRSLFSHLPLGLCHYHNSVQALFNICVDEAVE